MAWNNSKSLPPKPFTGLLEEVDRAAVTAEGSVRAQVKLGFGIPPGSERTVKAMRGIQRMLVALEPFWNSPLPEGKSVKQIMAEHEALYARRQAAYVQEEAKDARPTTAEPEDDEGPQLQD